MWGGHFTLNFLQVLCHSAFILFNPLQYAPSGCSPGKYWAITTHCDYCIKNIVDEPITCNLSLFAGYQTLHHLRLGQTSIEALRDSVREFEASKYKPVYTSVGIQDVTMATVAICEKLIEDEFRRYSRLRDYSGGYTMNLLRQNALANLCPQDAVRTIGFTEMRRVKIQTLCESLARAISHQIDQLYPAWELENVEHELSIRPVNELPCVHLLTQLYHFYLLGEIINWFQTITGISPTVCYDNPGIAAGYLGCCIHNMTLRGQIPPLICLTNPNQEDDFPKIIRRQAKLSGRKLMCSTMIPSLAILDMDTDQDAIVIRLATCLLIDNLTIFSNDEIDTILKQHILETNTNTVCLCPFDFGFCVDSEEIDGLGIILYDSYEGRDSGNLVHAFMRVTS